MSVTSPTATVTANHLWAAVLVATLADQGVKRAVVSPGSRSTPLALAVDAHPGIEVLVHADERERGRRRPQRTLPPSHARDASRP